MGSGNEGVTAPQQVPPRRTKLNSQMGGSRYAWTAGLSRGRSPERNMPERSMPESKKGRWLTSGPSLGRKRPRRAAVTQDALPHDGITGTGPHKMQEANHRLLTYSRTFFFATWPILPCLANGGGMDGAHPRVKGTQR